MKEMIQQRLKTIESQANIEIIYAVESGSRAWGFPSSDSDYDIRFIYVQPLEWYLTLNLEEKRDVIENPIDENKLDITGWDIRKTLKLLYKSNPALLEWFTSPIVYGFRSDIFVPLLEIYPSYFLPNVCMQHYRRIARHKANYYFNSNKEIKYFFYALRCLLAFQWVHNGCGPVPMPFEILVERMVRKPIVKQKVYEIIKTKKVSRELDPAIDIDLLEDYLNSGLAAIEAIEIGNNRSNSSMEELNTLFRNILYSI